MFWRLLRRAVVIVGSQQALHQWLPLVQRRCIAQGDTQTIRVQQNERPLERFDAFSGLKVQNAEVFVIDPYLFAGEGQDAIDRRLVVVPGSN